jgi:hypothetical protein
MMELFEAIIALSHSSCHVYKKGLDSSGFAEPLFECCSLLWSAVLNLKSVDEQVYKLKFSHSFQNC